jgi:cytochrome c553/mono/diheme cytochrome c family protein
MPRLLRWLRYAVAALVTLMLVAAATVYALSERVIRRTYDEPLVSIPIPTDSASIVEGGRIALIHGCRGCHARDMSGQVWEDDFWFGRQNAPNLTEAAQRYTDAELVRIIRRGVRPDGRSVWSMTSEMFAPLSDADLGKIIAYIRSGPPVAGLSRRFAPGPLARWEIVRGDYRPAAELVRETDAVTAAGYFPAGDEAHARGAYLARTSCPECHNLRLQGYPGDTPDLAIAAGYTPEQFAHFFATGEALGGRELPLMSVMARNRFSNFTDEEEAALYAYLVARARAIQAGR